MRKSIVTVARSKPKKIIRTISNKKYIASKCNLLSNNDISILYDIGIHIKNNIFTYTCKYNHEFISDPENICKQKFLCSLCHQKIIDKSRLLIYKYILANTLYKTIYNNNNLAIVNQIGNDVYCFIHEPHIYNDIEGVNLISSLKKKYKSIILVSSLDNKTQILKKMSKLTTYTIDDINNIFPNINMLDVIEHIFGHVLFKNRPITYIDNTGGFLDNGIGWTIAENSKILIKDKYVSKKTVLIHEHIPFKGMNTLNIHISEHSIFTIFEYIFRWVLKYITFNNVKNNKDIESYIKKVNRALLIKYKWPK